MMLCDRCKAAADHPSSYNPAQIQLAHCNHENGCACGNIVGPVEALYDPETVDLGWVRTRRTTNYSSQEVQTT